MKKIRKIHILGVYGAGKSTLARKLHKILGYKIYDIAELQWKKKYYELHSEKDLLKIISKISNKKSWITEGAHLHYTSDLFEEADLVIFLEINKKVAYRRILKRYLKGKLGLENHPRNNLRKVLNILNKTNKYFQNQDSNPSLRSHKEYLRKYAKKILIIKTKKELNDFLESVK